MMNFNEWHEKTIQKRKPTTKKRLWGMSIGFGIISFLAALLYIQLSGEASGIESVNRSLGVAAVLAVGASFALSGLCYFWNFVDTKIVYRKFVGIVGLDLALLHAGLSWYLYASPEHGGVNYSFGHIWNVGGIAISNFTTFIFGLLALFIFFAMFMASRSFIMPRLGGKLWREILRTGYVGLFFAAIHFSIKRSSVWASWFESKEPSILPPSSLLMLIFIVGVIALRLALHVALVNQESTKNKSSNTQSQKVS